MRKKFICGLLSTLLISTLFTGCSLFQQTDDTEDLEFNIEKVMKNLDDGGYYVVHKNMPTKIYFGNATFDEGNTTTTSFNSESTERIMWYTEDWENIPTFYKGDTLIYYSTEELTESFNFERFEDFGYSLGFCKMEETVSGRYKISTNENDNTTYPDHDTSEIINFPQENIIIETIGGKPIRKTNVTRIGSILGLEQGQTYLVEVYGGTELTKMYLKSDVRILGSMQDYVSHDFTFLSSTVIKINIPEWFNSGYYAIDGLGVFRYITGTEYNENMDLNVPNVNPDQTTNEEEKTVQDVFKYYLGDNELGKRVLTINLGPYKSDPKDEHFSETTDNLSSSSEQTVNIERVTCTLTTSEERPAFYTEKENDFVIKIYYTALTSGEYKVSLVGLNGRSYTYTDEAVSKDDTASKKNIN